MRLFPLFLASLLALSSSAAPVVEGALPMELIIEAPGPANKTLLAAQHLSFGLTSTLSKRDSCGWAWGYRRADYESLCTWLDQNPSWSDPLHPNWSLGWDWGTVRFCVYNWQDSDVWVSTAEMAWGARYIVNWCCDPNEDPGFCFPGDATGSATDGIPIQIVVKSSQWQC